MSSLGPLFVAAELADRKTRFVVVGSGALWLHGDDVVVPDVDIVPDPDAGNLERLLAVLGTMLKRGERAPVRRWPSDVDVGRVVTVAGPVDVLLERARAEYADLVSRAVPIDRLGTRVHAASRDDVLRLKKAFKAPA